MSAGSPPPREAALRREHLRRLVGLLSDEFPDSTHVTAAGLSNTDDRVVWEFAREHDFAIVSKDSDFADLAILRGAPPKAIWLRVGNASTKEIAELLRASVDRISAYELSPTESFLVLGAPGLGDTE